MSKCLLHSDREIKKMQSVGVFLRKGPVAQLAQTHRSKRLRLQLQVASSTGTNTG